jgi:hypothetical protein
MQINTSQISAAGRHALSFAMGAIAAAGAMHAISSDDASSLSTALTQIATGLATVVTILTGLYSAYLKSNTQQISAVANMPSVSSVVVATPEQANAIPSPKVISQ